MIIPDVKLPAVRRTINSLYSGEFNNGLIQRVASSVSEVIDGHYFAVLFFSNKFKPGHSFISNNPPDFLPVYLPLISSDFLIEHLVHTCRTTLLHDLVDWGLQHYREFCVEVQRVRPISDVIYVPIQVNGYLAGYWALGRAGLKSPIYSENDVAIFEFLSGFLSEAFKHSLSPSPVPENIALLDAFGRVLQSGCKIRKLFTEVFGPRFQAQPGAGDGYENKIFRNRYSLFLRGPRLPGCSEISLTTSAGVYSLSFRLLDPHEIRIHLPLEPQVKVILEDGSLCADDEISPFDESALQEHYGFTPRELEVLLGVYKGFTDREIGSSLFVEESTVKRHVHNILEKTGVNSRTQLVLKTGTF